MDFSQIFNPDFARLFSPEGFSAAGLFFIFFFATFVSEDAACLAAGTFAAQGRVSFALALSACLAGIFAGDVLLYWTGRIFGGSILSTKLFRRFVSENAVRKSSEWLEKRGAAAVFLSRFLTGLRLPTYLAAGFLRVRFLKFAFYLLLAAAIWTPLLIGSIAFSQQILFSGNFVFGGVLLFLFLKFSLRLSSWKNRRLFVGRLKRLWKWEFWSLRVFYFPVAVYVVWLAIKHRNPTIFTCANPAILAGGFVGESKNEIYQGLKKSVAASYFLLPYVFLSAQSSPQRRISQAERFIGEHKLNFPLVLKPDAGERGRGVKIVRAFSELERELRRIKQDCILQEFAEGVEASIFYCRRPNENSGRIFSVTEKRFPKVRGDGKADLETLILRDERAVCLANSYFEQNREKLETVPAEGEEIQIIDIGTHSRGAIFLDGEWLRTESLENKIDEIGRGFQGVYFGRFDIRAKSFADLRSAAAFKIVELNGVTSESTNIYDPRYNRDNRKQSAESCA